MILCILREDPQWFFIFVYTEDWCAALANMVHIIPSIPQYAISSTLRIYIASTKDLATEVDLLLNVGHSIKEI